MSLMMLLQRKAIPSSRFLVGNVGKRAISSKHITDTPSLIIFDKDGTLVSFGAWTTWIERCAALIESAAKKNLADKIFKTVGYLSESKKVEETGLLACSTIPIIKKKLAEVLQAEGFRWTEAKSIIENCVSKTEIESNFFISVGDVNGLFSKLKENGVKIAICTADNRQVTLDTMKALNVTALVDHVVCGDDKENVPKPNPANALNICSQLNVSPSQTFVIGDTLADIRMGKSAGVGLSIGVLTGVGSKDSLAKEADLILNSIDDLLNLTSPSMNPIISKPRDLPHAFKADRILF